MYEEKIYRVVKNKKSFGTKQEFIEDMKKRLSFIGLYKLHDRVDSLENGVKDRKIDSSVSEQEAKVKEKDKSEPSLEENPTF